MDPFLRVDDPLKIWRGSMDFESPYIDPSVILMNIAGVARKYPIYKK